MQGRGGVAREIAHGVHVCGFSSCDAFRPDGGVEARVLSAGSAHVAAGLFNLFGEGFRVGAIGFRRHFATLPIHVAPSVCARLRLGVSWAPLKGPLHIIYNIYK